MTTCAVHKPYPTAPIGRCTCCGVPTYDMAALNVRCDECDGVVASVAMPDWRRCPACRRTGQSLISAKTVDGCCPVCRGAGWITVAEYPAAESELLVQQSAVDNALDAATGQRVAPSRYSLRSKLGSLARLAVARPYDMLRRLQDTLLAYQLAVEKRTSDTARAAPHAEPPRLTFLSGAALRLPSTKRHRPVNDQRELADAHDEDAQQRGAVPYP
jgi:hypothetical protein